VRLDPALREEIERIAQAEEHTISQVLRIALKRYIRDHNTDPDSKAAA
jgi:Mn-dependent DtxR family transcriptional regulator